MTDFVISADIKGLIFDCDGTIADTMPLHYLAYEKALGKDAACFTKKTFYEQAGVPAEQVMELLKDQHNLDFDPAEVAHRKEKIYHDSLTEMSTIAAVEQIVREYGKCMPTAVASGGTRENVLKTLQLVGLDDFFDTVVAAEEVEHGKPSPDMFLLAASRLGVDPKHCLVFEDGEKGFEAAEAAGMKWIDVRPWYGEKEG